MSQLNIDFTHTVHLREKSSYGQTFLDKSRKRLGGQNKRVYESLQTGTELDDLIVRQWTPPIFHLHSRVSDLVNVFGFKISKKYNKEKNLTTYYCTPEQIEYNNILLDKLQQIQ